MSDTDGVVPDYDPLLEDPSLNQMGTEQDEPGFHDYDELEPDEESEDDSQGIDKNFDPDLDVRRDRGSEPDADPDPDPDAPAPGGLPE